MSSLVPQYELDRIKTRFVCCATRLLSMGYQISYSGNIGLIVDACDIYQLNQVDAVFPISLSLVGRPRTIEHVTKLSAIARVLKTDLYKIKALREGFTGIFPEYGKIHSDYYDLGYILRSEVRKIRLPVKLI